MNIIVVVSADIEWRAVCKIFPRIELNDSPMGEWFIKDIPVNNQVHPIYFFHGGWGKIAAAASTQYIIDRWKPDLLINLGTCGGIEGEIEKGTIVLVEQTIVYDLIELMGESRTAISDYATDIDVSWLGNNFPMHVCKTVMLSGDRDMMTEEVNTLKTQYGAKVADWESGAIAFVASKNKTRLLILRGVTDLVSESGGEAYGKIELFEQACQNIMQDLVLSLPGWLEATRML